MGVTIAILNQKSIEMSFQFHLSKSKAESWHPYLSAGVLVCCIYTLMLQTVMQRTAWGQSTEIGYFKKDLKYDFCLKM